MAFFFYSDRVKMDQKNEVQRVCPIIIASQFDVNDGIEDAPNFHSEYRLENRPHPC